MPVARLAAAQAAIEGEADDFLSGLTAQGNDLIVCGWLHDTVNFMGQYIPVPGEQLFFVARLNSYGQPQNIKLSTPPQDSSFCYFFFPGECGTDALRSGRWCQRQQVLDKKVRRDRHHHGRALHRRSMGQGG